MSFYDDQHDEYLNKEDDDDDDEDEEDDYDVAVTATASRVLFNFCSTRQLSRGESRSLKFSSISSS